MNVLFLHCVFITRIAVTSLESTVDGCIVSLMQHLYLICSTMVPILNSVK